MSRLPRLFYLGSSIVITMRKSRVRVWLLEHYCGTPHERIRAVIGEAVISSQSMALEGFEKHSLGQSIPRGCPSVLLVSNRQGGRARRDTRHDSSTTLGPCEDVTSAGHRCLGEDARGMELEVCLA